MTKHLIFFQKNNFITEVLNEYLSYSSASIFKESYYSIFVSNHMTLTYIIALIKQLINFTINLHCLKFKIFTANEDIPAKIIWKFLKLQ